MWIASWYMEGLARMHGGILDEQMHEREYCRQSKILIVSRMASRLARVQLTEAAKNVWELSRWD